MFYLRPGGGDKPKPINLKYYSRSSRKNFEYATRQKILASHWDQASQSPTRDPKGRMRKEDKTIYESILPYAAFLKYTISRFTRENKLLSVEALRYEFDAKFNREKKPKALQQKVPETLELFIKIKTDNKALEESSLQKYKTLLLHIENFEMKNNKPLKLDGLNSEFYTEFVLYCRKDLKLQDNTLARYIMSLKSFLRWADENGYQVDPAYRDYKRIDLTSVTFALNEEEVLMLYEYNYPEEELRRSVDVFTFGCYTGQMYTDLKEIRKENIVNGIVYLKQQKSKNMEVQTEVEIPLNKIASKILMKYSYRLPYISIQRFNSDLKEAAKLAGFNELTEKTIQIGAKNYIERIEKWQRISSNIMRRTFVKMSLDKGMSLNEIAMITGHRHLSSLRQYDKTSIEQLRTKVYSAYGPPE